MVSNNFSGVKMHLHLIDDQGAAAWKAPVPATGEMSGEIHLAEHREEVRRHKLAILLLHAGHQKTPTNGVDKLFWQVLVSDNTLALAFDQRQQNAIDLA